MTPKLFFCLLIVLAAGPSTRAQTQRTLQISEVDTLLLNPTSIDYVVSKNPRTGIVWDQNSKDKSGSENGADGLANAMKLIREHHIKWVSGINRGYRIGGFGVASDSGITITVHSEAELKSLFALLSPISGITGSIGQIEFEPMPDRVSIYKILYARAQTDAIGMAAVSGKMLGDLISVEEPQDFFWSLHPFTEGIENFSGAMAAGFNQNTPGRLQKKVEIKMLFRFELK